MRKAPMFILIGLLLLAAASQSMYTVHETENAIVLQLGKPTGETMGPGLHFKLPFVQNVIHFEDRILEYDAKPAEILTADKKTLVVDNYSKWRITDPLMFYQTVRNIPGAQARLDDIIYSQLRVSLGRYTLSQVVSSVRTDILTQVTKNSSRLVKEFGIEVLDVRIKRADLPAENERAIYGRMRTERERQAKQYRSEGQEESAKIKSMADRQKVVIVAEATRQGEILRGEGEAEATKIYAEAFGKSPEFYSFSKRLQAYVKSFENNSQVVLSSDSEFLKFMK